MYYIIIIITSFIYNKVLSFQNEAPKFPKLKITENEVHDSVIHIEWHLRNFRGNWKSKMMLFNLLNYQLELRN